MHAVIAFWFVILLLALWGRRSWLFISWVSFLVFSGLTLPLDIENLFSFAQWGVLGVTPLFLFTGKKHQVKVVRALQAKEANKMRQLAEVTRHVSAMHDAADKLESQINQVTDVYDVTKLTSQAMSTESLCRTFLKAGLDRIPAQSIRWIEWDPQQVMCVVRAEEAVLNYGKLKEKDLALIQQAKAFASEIKSGIFWSLEEPVSVWSILYRDDRPFGILAMEGLAKKYEAMFASIVNQLSLQLERVSLYQRVESLATVDALTGIFVRRHFLELAQKELERSKRQGLSCTLCMIDLDHFKQKNDTYGHLIGDVILREVAQLLKKNLRDIDLIGRYGGEELVLMFVETDLDQALPVIERLRQMVEIHAIQAYDELISQTVSMGITALHDEDNLETFIDRADKALLRAKDKGRNCIESESVPC